MNEEDEAFLYVTNSFRRVDVLFALSELGYARNYEVAGMLLLKQSNTLSVLGQLESYDFEKKEKVDKRMIYSLTDSGKDMVQKLKDYYGTDRK